MINGIIENEKLKLWATHLILKILILCYRCNNFWFLRPQNKKINPLYAYLNVMKGMNVRWVEGCKSGNPDLELPNFGKC